MRRVRDVVQRRQSLEQGHVLQEGTELLLSYTRIRIEAAVANSVWTETDDPDTLGTELSGEIASESLDRRARHAEPAAQGNGQASGRSRKRENDPRALGDHVPRHRSRRDELCGCPR